MTDGVGLGAHLVDAKGKEADCAKHEEELGQGGRGLDLVDVWCPHALDVVVLGDLERERVRVSGASCREPEKGYGTYWFTKVYAFLVVPPALWVAELPARRRESRVTHCVPRCVSTRASGRGQLHSQGKGQGAYWHGERVRHLGCRGERTTWGWAAERSRSTLRRAGRRWWYA